MRCFKLLVSILMASLAAACSAYPVSEMSEAVYVEANGIASRVAEWGSGSPILLIHGASSTVSVFEPTVAPLLSPSHRLVAYDRPGMGLSKDRPQDAHTLKVQADVAAGVIGAMDMNRPIVIGHSFGGAVALRLALDHPEKVSGLILIGAPAYDWPGGVAWHYHWAASPGLGPLFNHVLTRPFVGGALKSGVEGLFAPQDPPEGYIEASNSRLATTPGALRANGQDVRALKQELIAQAPRYSDIKLPVGILVGDSDGVVSPELHSRRLAETLPNARLEVLEGVGHAPHEIAPQTLQALVDWVARQSGETF